MFPNRQGSRFVRCVLKYQTTYWSMYSWLDRCFITTNIKIILDTYVGITTDSPLLMTAIMNLVTQ